MGRKERGDRQDVTEGARSPDESRRGEKEGTTSSSTVKHRHLILRGQSLGIVQADVRGSGMNHPIIDKLGVLEARPTDRQTETLKDLFAYLGGKLGKLPNQIRATLAREIIKHLNV